MSGASSIPSSPVYIDPHAGYHLWPVASPDYIDAGTWTDHRIGTTNRQCSKQKANGDNNEYFS